MRIRLSHPAVLKFVALLIAGAIRLWVGTLVMRFRLHDRAARPGRDEPPCVYLFWHEGLLLMAGELPVCGREAGGMTMLVSRHHDGELIAQVIRLLGGRTIRGSSRRGGASALREMLRHGQGRCLAITPDGPRGPRRRVQGGAVYLASRAGLALVPVGVAAGRAWRAPSWDRMLLPRPFQPARVVMGKRIEIPADLPLAQFDSACRQVQEAMDRVQADAEALLAGTRGTRELLTREQLWRRDEGPRDR